MTCIRLHVHFSDIFTFLHLNIDIEKPKLANYQYYGTSTKDGNKRLQLLYIQLYKKLKGLRNNSRSNALAYIILLSSDR